MLRLELSPPKVAHHLPQAEWNSPQSGSAKLVYNSATDSLFYNPDSATLMVRSLGFGNGGLFATVNGSVSLDATDFWVQA